MYIFFYCNMNKWNWEKSIFMIGLIKPHRRSLGKCKYSEMLLWQFLVADQLGSAASTAGKLWSNKAWKTFSRHQRDLYKIVSTNLVENSYGYDFSRVFLSWICQQMSTLSSTQAKALMLSKISESSDKNSSAEANQERHIYVKAGAFHFEITIKEREA